MTNNLNPIQSTVVTGLGTQSMTIVTAGLYTIAPNFTIPYQPAGGKGDSTQAAISALTINVNVNGGAAILTLSSPTPTQPSMGGSVRAQLAVNDVVNVVLASANVADNVPNAIKGIINLYAGF